MGGLPSLLIWCCWTTRHPQNRYHPKIIFLIESEPESNPFSLVAHRGWIGATRSSPMGWPSREFLRLPLCEEGGAAFGSPHLGDLSRLAVQPESDLRYLAVCNLVRADGGGHGHSEHL